MRNAWTAVLVLAAASAAAEPAPLAWELVAGGDRPVFWAHRNHELRVVLRNVGTESWSAAAGDNLSYHWLSADGRVVVKDGLRTRLPDIVRPGELATVTARVAAPPDAGRWVLVWEMVREQVRWYGPPAGPQPARGLVLVVWRCGVFQVGYAFLAIAIPLALRRTRREGALAAAHAALPALLAWGGALVATTTFSELAGRQLWRHAAPMAIGASALVALPTALFPVRWRRWVGAITATAVGGLVLADLVHLRWFGTLIPVAAALAWRQVGRVEGSIAALLEPRDALLLPAAVAALIGAALWPKSPPPGQGRARRVVAALTLATMAGAAFIPVRTLWRGLGDRMLADQVFSQAGLVERWGVLSTHLFDAMREAREALASEPLTAERRDAVERFFAARAGQLGAPPAWAGAERGSNLVLIQVESLQEWVVHARVGGVPVMPFLDGARGRALYFPQVFDQTAHGRSSDAEFIALNSLHALERGAVAFRRPANHFVTLATVLREAGYATLSAHAYEPGFWNRGVLHPRYGFTRSLFGPDLGSGEIIGWGLADGAFLAAMAPVLEKQPRPFFAFLITLGLHHPFEEFPARHKRLEVGALRDTPLGNYLNAMHYADSVVAAFVADLAARGLAADTVVALYGDHEAGFGRDPRVLAVAGSEGDDESTLLRLRRVPLLILAPHLLAGGEIAAVGGQVDIAPTLLSLLGLPRPGSFIGAPLTSGRSVPAVLAGGSAVASDRLFVARGYGVPDSGLCFNFPAGGRRPLEECSALKVAAAEELLASQDVVEHDLAERLGAQRR